MAGDLFYKPLTARWKERLTGWNAEEAKEKYEKAKTRYDEAEKAWQAAVKPATADKKKAPPRSGSLRRRPRPPVDPGLHPHRPSNLYNGMIAPLVPLAIRGAIWYQGESNASRAWQYRKLFPAMIVDWRKNWAQGDFTFLYVQLANFRARKGEPADSDWAELREAQNLCFSGPMYESMSVDGKRVRIKFKHTCGGLIAKGGGALKGFAIAGKDRKFVWADNPECNRYNKKAELPASPFRTDGWPCITKDKH